MQGRKDQQTSRNDSLHEEESHGQPMRDDDDAALATVRGVAALYGLDKASDAAVHIQPSLPLWETVEESAKLSSEARGECKGQARFRSNS